MAPSIQRKYGVLALLMRAVSILALVQFLVCSGSLSCIGADAEIPSETTGVRIVKIIPNDVLPGSVVEIRLEADTAYAYPVPMPLLRSGAKADYRVTFDGANGRVLLVGSDALKVEVPPYMEPDDNVWVVVIGPKFETPQFPIRMRRPSLLELSIDFYHKDLLRMIIWIVNALIFVGCLSLLAYGLRRIFPRKKPQPSPVAETPASKKSPDVELEIEPAIGPLQHPDELIAACRKGECVLFAGSGLSRLAGRPTWPKYVEGLLQWAQDNEVLDSNLGVLYRKALESGQVDLVADGVARAVTSKRDPEWDNLLNYLRSVLLKPIAQPTTVYRLLSEIGFTCALTTNLDCLLEQALGTPGDESIVFTPRDAEILLSELSLKRLFVLKLFGTLERPETVLISPAQYRDTIADNRIFLEFIEKLFLSRTILFIGTSLDEVESGLEALRIRNMGRPHFALAEVGGAEWPAKAEALPQRFGVHVLPYAAGDGESALNDFLVTLVKKTKRERAAPKAAQSEPPCLKSVHLENIGPFETIDLQFDPRWNILLGDNGVGKSSILKAIALALSGKHGRRYAGRFIRFHRPKGIIDLTLTDGAKIVAALERTSGEPEIRIVSERELLGPERWLAMGFPPLRLVGWTLPSGPQPKPGTPYTTPGDLLPLVAGDPDPRMSELKQAVINIYSRSEVKGDERCKKLFEDFFDVIDKLTPGVTCREPRIDPNSWEIFVKTDDGEAPLAAVSQGTQSLMGWIGLLLERLYEVYEDRDSPREGPALVLIDEIDAHMHPMWQQSIVHSLSELFPNVQFIATTHSPLIVTEVSRDQVRVLSRDPDTKQVFARLPDVDSEYLRADQVLTSPLFGLSRSRGSKGAGDIATYADLLGMKRRTAQEDERLQELQAKLKAGLKSTDTPARRQVEEAVQTTLRQMEFREAGMSDAARRELSDETKLEIKRQLVELFGKEEQKP